MKPACTSSIPAFIAPCLDIGSSEFLMSLLRRQIEILGLQERIAGRRPPPARPAPGRLQRQRDRQLLAAAHGEYRRARTGAYLERAPRPSRSAVGRAAAPGGRSLDLFHGREGARSAGLQSRQPGLLFHDARPEDPRLPGDGDSVEVHLHPAARDRPLAVERHRHQRRILQELVVRTGR